MDDRTPGWMMCETRGPWVANSLRENAKMMRSSEARCRKAFRKEYMGVPTQYLADVYAEAAAVFEKRLAEVRAAAHMAREGG